MTRILLALVGTLALAATAAAEYDPDKEPCPEDMMCTTEAVEEPSNGTDTCMDGSGADCDDGLQYLDGGEAAEAAAGRNESPLAAVVALGGAAAAALLARRR